MANLTNTTNTLAGTMPEPAEATPIAGESPRLGALRRLQQNLPVASQNLANQFQAGRDMQLQKAVQAAPVAAPVTQTAQQLGTGLAQQAGQQASSATENLQKQQGQVAQLGTQQYQQEASASLADTANANQQEMMAGRERLGKLSEQAANQMLDSRLQFAKDESGRTFFNERQLSDFAKSSARSQEELRGYAQKADQVEKSSLRIMKAASDKMQEALKNTHRLEQLGYNQDMIKEMKEAAYNMQIDLQKREAEMMAKTSQSALMGGVVGGIIGVGGAVLTDNPELAPAAGAAGYTIGTGAGQAVAAG